MFTEQRQQTYDNPGYCILGLPHLDPGFARYNLARHRMEGDLYRFCNVCEFLRHKKHCIVPIGTIQYNRLVWLKQRGTTFISMCLLECCTELLVNNLMEFGFIGKEIYFLLEPYNIMIYCMAKSASGQDGSIMPAWDFPRCSCKKKFFCVLQKNPLITKLVRSRWLHIGLVLFFAFLLTNFIENLANI